MRKLLIAIFIFFVSMPISATAFGQNAELPQTDFYLYSGVRPMMQSPPFSYMIERVLFTSAHVEIVSGKITANKTVPFHLEQGVNESTGTASLKMTGDYDKDNGQLSGTFTINYVNDGIWHGDEVEHKGHSTTEFTGTFNGQVVEEKVFVRYNGMAHVFGWNEKALDTENFDYTETYTISTVWRQNGFTKRVEEPEAPVDLNENFLDENGNTVDSKASFAVIHGQIEIHIPGTAEGEWKLVKMGTPIPVGARIRTVDDSQVTIGFEDCSTFTLKGDSEVIITKQPDRPGKLSLIAGKIYSNVKKILTDGTVEIDSNQAVLGIKGTTFTVEALADKTIVNVIEGVIEMKAKTGTQVSEVTSGKSATIDNAGAITAPIIFDVIAEQNSWDEGDKIDFASFEALPPAKTVTAEPAQAKQSFPIFYIIGGVVVACAVFALVLRRKR